ncbi:MAG: MBL fold metallo-hydrolase [Rhodocyclaceae bacterium]|nr:MBL fold metallo-hydrolase [Rhodocyclaceae bacterium]
MPFHYPFSICPIPGQAQEVADGVFWLRMPLPFALDHVNLWLIEDEGGYCAVDTGYALAETQAAWRQALEGKRLTRLWVTHFHPDHLGLAAWLEERYEAPLAMTQGEFLTAHLVWAGIAPFDFATMIEFYRRHGLDEARAAALRARGNAYRQGVTKLPTRFQRVFDGDVIRIGRHDWRVIVGFGHAPEHMSLYCEALGVLIAGDMLLPKISTNVSSYAAAPIFDALDQFLSSLMRFHDLPDDTLVLPAHGLPFHGHRERIAALVAHHAARCDELALACRDTPRSAADLLDVLFGRAITDAHQTMFAMGEAIAHLIHLERKGVLSAHEENGVIRYRSV